MTDKQLVRYAAQFRKGVLNGDSPLLMCFAVCAPLETLLGMAGVAVKLIEGEWWGGNHFWLALPDGRVLDPTADQFGLFESGLVLPPVYLGPATEVHKAIGRGLVIGNTYIRAGADAPEYPRHSLMSGSQ